MMYCPNCGSEIEEYHKFCPNCGAKIVTEEQVSEASQPAPPPRDAEPTPDTVATPSQPPPAIDSLPEPPPRVGTESTPLPLKKGPLGKIGREDIDEVTGKAKKGLGSAWKSVRKGISKGAQIAGQGIESAKDTFEERRTHQRDKNGDIRESSGAKFCPNCGHAVSVVDKFCKNCGHRLE
jgi:RNA polymerase subunit RPABC4/transcription elongation factor Spt4